MKQFERRVAVVRDLEIREQGDTFTLTGYASTFNEQYDMGWYLEEVDPAAFNRTLGRNPDVSLLINHDGLPLARTTSQTLDLSTDSIGLRAQAQLDAGDPDVQRLVPKMRRGDVNKMSFAFRTISDKWEYESEPMRRRLLEVDIDRGDVSVVTNPANPGTSASVRSLGPNIDAVTSALRFLEQRGASNEDVVSVLTRALGYFTAIDTIVDNAQDEIAETLGIPNPDDDTGPDSDDMARAAALAELEIRLRLLRLAG
jgi:HK97 family phage prohead protease